MKKFVSILLSILLFAGLGINALAAEGFNAGLSVDRSTDGRIIVSVEDSEVLNTQKPHLSIPADESYAQAVVFLEDSAEKAVYANGYVTFTVYKGGNYCIAAEAELTDSIAADCTRDGKNEYLFDGDTYVEVIAALGHDFTNTASATCANCEESNPNYVSPTVPSPPQENPDADVPSASFEDVEPDAWYIGAVDFVVKQKLFKGVSETEFAPENTMTRAMFWTVLARMSGENVDGGEIWYEEAQHWAMENGISDGTGHDEAISREQIVTMLWRLAGSPSSSAEISSYIDAGNISEWAQDAMCWAIEFGVIEGYEDNSLKPQAEAKRSETAQLIMNYLK